MTKHRFAGPLVAMATAAVVALTGPLSGGVAQADNFNCVLGIGSGWAAWGNPNFEFVENAADAGDADRIARERHPSSIFGSYVVWSNCTPA